MAGCKLYRKRLSAYLDGVLPHKKQAALAEHLTSCAPCRKQLAQLQGLGPLLEHLEVPPPPADMATRILAAAGRAPGNRVFRGPVLHELPRPWAWGFRAAGAAIMLILMLYLGQFTYMRGWLPGSEGHRTAISMTAGSGAEGLEWFAPGPPGSIVSGYLAMAGPRHMVKMR
jgi:hypothetical protein